MPITLQTIKISEFIKNYVNGKLAILEDKQIEMTSATGEMQTEISVDPEQLCRVFQKWLSFLYAKKRKTIISTYTC